MRSRMPPPRLRRAMGRASPVLLPARLIPVPPFHYYPSAQPARTSFFASLRASFCYAATLLPGVYRAALAFLTCQGWFNSVAPSPAICASAAAACCRAFWFGSAHHCLPPCLTPFAATPYLYRTDFNLVRTRFCCTRFVDKTRAAYGCTRVYAARRAARRAAFNMPVQQCLSSGAAHHVRGVACIFFSRFLPFSPRYQFGSFPARSSNNNNLPLRATRSASTTY